jgi:hemerythrin-like domain-containing protein
MSPPRSAVAAEAPKPSPFGIMRNVHEALRASIASQRSLLDAGDLPAFSAERSDFSRGLTVHIAMEDEAMFPLLQEVSLETMTSAMLPDEHREDMRLTATVNAALAAAPVDKETLRAAWSTWADDHLHHLTHEEEVMMPLIQKTAPTAEGRARLVHDRLLSAGERQPDFDWFVGWVTRRLNGYASATMPANASLRGFAAALQSASSPAQWRRLRPIVRSNFSEAVWAELVAKAGLDGDGHIVDHS